MSDATRRAILSRMPAAAIATGAVLGSAAVAEAADQPDAKLLRLGRQLEAAWATERALINADEETFNLAIDASSAIVDQIEVIPAKSLADLKVKALALSWCHSGDQLDPDSLNEQGTTDVRIAASIVRDLLSL